MGVDPPRMHRVGCTLTQSECNKSLMGVLPSTIHRMGRALRAMRESHACLGRVVCVLPCACVCGSVFVSVSVSVCLFVSVATCTALEELDWAGRVRSCCMKHVLSPHSSLGPKPPPTHVRQNSSATAMGSGAGLAATLGRRCWHMYWQRGCSPIPTVFV